ncbi:MAG: caspase family protein [Desulfomonilaceae bacterium]
MGTKNSRRLLKKISMNVLSYSLLTVKRPPEILKVWTHPFLSLVRLLIATTVIVVPLCTIFEVAGIGDLAAAEESMTPRAVVRTRTADQDRNETVLGKGDLYALVVGVSKHSNPKLCLDFAAKDAKDFADFIQTQTKVFKNTHVKLMTDGEANKREIEKYLFHDLLKAGKDDTIILFFSGHGTSDPAHPDNFYFVTSDADPEYLEATALNMTGLKFLDRLDSEHVVLITDACHAGMPVTGKTRSVVAPLEKFMNMFTEASGRVFLASCKPEELSQEKPDLQNGVFTHFLLQGLKGEADLHRDGIVTVDEAYQYAYERTKNETKGAQHPTWKVSGSGRFPLSVLGKLENEIKLDVWFVAQDSRCANPNCIDPESESAECKDPLCGDITIENGSVLYSGQNFQIGVRPQIASYVYVYQIDTAGNIFKLFPGTDFVDAKNYVDNPLEGGKVYWIPGKERWLRLDKTEGQEKIYVVASRSRNALLEDLYNSLQDIGKDGVGSGQSDKIKENMELTLTKMGVETKTHVKAASSHSAATGPRKERSFEELSHAIESAGLDAVESVWFHHKGQKPGR